MWILAPYGGMSTVQEFDTGLGEADIDPERPRALETPFGTMAGTYELVSEKGLRLDAEIAEFQLCEPRAIH